MFYELLFFSFLAYHCDLTFKSCHAKTGLQIFVAIIPKRFGKAPKEGSAAYCLVNPLVHSKILLDLPECMTRQKISRPVLAWNSSINIDAENDT